MIARAQARSLPLIEPQFEGALPALPVFLVLRNVPRYRLVIKTLDTALRRGLA